MSSRRVYLLSVCLAFAAVVGAQACATEGELNPQPLPPTPTGEGDGKGDDGSGGFNGGPGAPADAAIPSTTDDSGCPDAGTNDALVDEDGGIEAGPLVDDASCGDGG